jgi:hypothetical protein
MNRASGNMILLIVILHYVNKKGAAVNSAKNRAEGQHGLTVYCVWGNLYYHSKVARYIFRVGIAWPDSCVSK